MEVRLVPVQEMAARVHQLLVMRTASISANPNRTLFEVKFYEFNCLFAG